MKKYLIGIASVIVLLFLGTFLFRYFGNYPTANDKTVVEVTIPSGLGVKKIAKILHEKELINSELGFITQAYLKGAKGDLKAGTYSFTRSESGSTLLRRIMDGDVISRENKVTIQEGLTLKEISQKLEQANIVSAAAFEERAKVEDFRQDFSFLKDVPDGPLEGYLFPDTYKFYKNASVDDVIKKILARFDNQFTIAAKETRGLQGHTLHEVVTMASIIEREVRSVEDRKIVSGILWSRIEENVAIAADATIRYILNNWSSPLTIDDLKISSPYNSRTNLGLPPRPIGNPGLEALKAAMDPKDTDYFYYLSSKDGKTIFSKTLDEHNAAVRQYLR